MTFTLGRRTLFSAVIAVAALAALAVVQTAASKSAGQTKVSGSGVRAASAPGNPEVTFAFAGSTKAGAGGVNGSFSISIPGNLTATGVLTCVHVNGNTATVGGVITSGLGIDDVLTTPGDLTGDWFMTTVQDNGKAPKGGVSPDMMGFAGWAPRGYWAAPDFQSLCNDPVPDLGTTMFPLVSGDIKVGK
jgi:hypothetical protein